MVANAGPSLCPRPKPKPTTEAISPCWHCQWESQRADLGESPHPRASYQASLLPPKILLKLKSDQISVKILPVAHFIESKPSPFAGP